MIIFTLLRNKTSKINIYTFLIIISYVNTSFQLRICFFLAVQILTAKSEFRLYFEQIFA